MDCKTEIVAMEQRIRRLLAGLTDEQLAMMESVVDVLATHPPELPKVLRPTLPDPAAGS